MATGYGLSAAIWNTGLTGLLDKNLRSFFLYTGVLFVITALMQTVFLRVRISNSSSADRTDSPDEQSAMNSPHLVSTPTVLASNPQINPSNNRAAGRTGARSYAPLEEGAIAANSAGANMIPGPIADSSSRAAVTNERPFQGKWRTVVQSRIFWTVGVMFVLMQSVGSGLFIGNLKLITSSFGFTGKQGDALVTYVSFCNAAGRLSAGALADFSVSCCGQGRLFWFSGLLIFIACVGLYTLEINAFFFLSVATGYGMNWALMPSFMTKTFGKQNMVFCFCASVFVMSLTVKIVSKVTADAYDRNKPAGDDTCSRNLSGCFKTPAAAGMSMVGSSAFLGLFLWRFEAAAAGPGKRM